MTDKFENELKAFVEEYYDCKQYNDVIIKEIKINQLKKKIVLDLENGHGLVIGKSGQNIKKVHQVLIDKFGKGWKLDLAPDGKVPGSGQSGRGRQNKRSIINNNIIPLTVPFSTLNDETVTSKLTKYLESSGPILVTLFRDTMGESEVEHLLKVKGNMNKRKLNFALQVIEKFPNRKVKVLEWPTTFRSQFDSKRTSHAYISYCCRAAVIVYDEKHDISDEQPYENALIQAVHDWTILDAKRKWVILGDETGSLLEFSGEHKKIKDFSAMCWVVVPPGAQLPGLSSEFHCIGENGVSDYKMAIKHLSENKELFYFTFNFDEGNIEKSQNILTNDPHLQFWQDTLPLVLEKIANSGEGKHLVDIFVEQVGPLETGRDLLVGQIAEYKSSLSGNRNRWNNLDFDQIWVIAKGEHPWIGYPDAIGANLKRRFSKSLKNENIQLDRQLNEKLVKNPYRQTSLNGAIRQLHKDTARPLVFLKSLADISIEDQRDYVEVFFPQAITESIQALNQGEWQKLLSHMDETSKTKQGQSASTLIHKRTDILVTLAKLEREPDRFNFCLAMLGTSNHIGAKDQAELCESVLNNLIEKGYNPPRERTMKFKNLLKGKADNYFDFSHISPFKIDEDLGEEEMKYLGAQAQSRALRGSQNDIAEALEIESFLLRKTNHEDDILRRMILHAELMMEKGKYAAAYEFLTVDLVKSVSKPVTTLFQDAYYLATLLKSGSLSTQNQKSLEILSDYIPRLLTDNHPSQRIAYWCVRWLDTLEEDMQALNEACLSHLITLTTIPIFTHDAPGIILSCEILDLDSRGYSIPKLDIEKFYNRVKGNSQLTTQTWLEKHPPNEDDWLAPLNFNYR